MADAAIQYVGGSQLLADLSDWKRLVAKRKHGGARKKLELFDLGEFGDDVFGHTVAKVFVLFVAAGIGEVQHGDGLFGPKSRRCDATKRVENFIH